MNPTTAFTLRQTHEGSQDGAAEATRQEHIHGIFRNTSNRSEETTGDIPTFINRGRYTSRGIDRHPPIPPSQVLLFQKQRPGRLTIRRTVDPVADQSFGDAIVYKAPNTTRVMFQNVKGLTSTQEGSDYRYFLSSMLSYSVDIFGMAETNSGWQHPHLRNAFKQCVQRQFQYGKTVFGSPSVAIDPLHDRETFHAGGVLQLVRGALTTAVFGPPITDPTGLGRWSGFTLIGKDGQKFSIITGYRTCASSISSAPLGSTFHREYVYYQEQGEQHPQPRTNFLTDISSKLRELREQGHALLLMMDSNAVLERDHRLENMLMSQDLEDLHRLTPAPSTFIGSANRRIDYMFGCPRTRNAMSRQGTLSYFEGPQSDHRALYIDINLSSLFGADVTETSLPTIHRRALKSGNPELTERYHKAIREYYSDHRMKERIDTLFKTHRAMTRQQVRKFLTAWDDDQGRAMLKAENSLRVRPKLYKWSPRLRNAGVLMRYWKLRLREHQYGEDYYTTFSRWERQIQSCDPSFVLPDRSIELPICEVRKRLNQATKVLRKTQKDASELHNNNYAELLETYEMDNNPLTKTESARKARIVKRTLLGETSRQLFGKLRQIVKPTEYSALSQVLVPRHPESSDVTPPGQVHNLLQHSCPDNLIWDTVITREDIEAHLLSFNREAFRAAAESPCGHGLIHDALTFTSLSPESEALLQGEIPEEWYGDRDLLREFLASFQIPGSVLESGPISCDITAADIVKGFKSWKETTTTSPSGRHLGHYKAMIQDKMLLECFRKFMNIAISRGISIPRWSNAVNVMIEKDPGRPQINRLRIIHLFEADYNLFLKIMWGSRLVRRSVQLHLLNDGQHGSVPGRTTMDPVMLNQLTTDLCRVLKINYARFDNDASACFDRIIVALGMLAARRCGMPPEAIRTHATSLELMKYMVKTVYGVSEESYSGTPLEPLFGTGQGSGASPSVWLSLVVLLLNTLERVIPDRISFRSVDGSITHRRLVDAFVDDTAIGITDDGTKSIHELTTALETVAQTWEQLLHFSGGALNLKKCSWYIMYWDWRNGRPQMRPSSPSDPPINLYQGSSSHHQRATIRRQEIDESARILGVHQTPSGDFSAHIKALKAKADKFAGYLKSPRLTPGDIRVFHRTIYDPAMRYSLPAVAVDEEELAQVQTKIIPTIVQKLGLSSKLPVAVRHGPISMGGLGLMDLRTEGGIEMIKYFRHEVYGNTEVGKLLLLQLQASQLESGVPMQLLAEPSLHIPYLTPTWILSMRQFMSNHNISMDITNVLSLPLRGPHDQYIMNSIRLKGYTTQQQTDINLIRLFLQVTTIADMVDCHEPSKIAAWALDGIRPTDFVVNTTWPRQQTPTVKQQRLWRRYIASQFLRYGRAWRVAPQSTLKDLKTQVSMESSQQHDDALTLSSRLKRLPRNTRRLLSHINFTSDEDTLWKACQRKQILTIASDGGLKGRKGTFGWSVTTPKNDILCEGAGPIDGPYDTASSTRCELGGYAAALLFLSLLHRHWGHRHKCTFRWVTDSQTAINNVVRETRASSTKTRQPANSDYLGVIRSETKSLRRKITTKWIKGHQTVRSDVCNGHTRDVIRNNHVDSLATWYREQSNKRQSIEKTDHTPEARVTVLLNGVRLVSQVESSIQFHINGYHLRLHIQSQNRWSNATWNRIDVEALGRFYRRLPPAAQVAQTKFMFNQWHTGVTRIRNAKVKDLQLRLCPCCKTMDETTQHVLQCRSNSDHEKGLQVFRKTLSPKEPHPVFHILRDGIISWVEGIAVYDPPFDQIPSKFHERLRVALSDQLTIGWDNAVKGYLSVEWRFMAEEAMFDSSPAKPDTGYYRIQNILKAVHVLTQTTWKARNNMLHDNQDTINRHIREAEAAEITAMHRQSETLRAGDRHYCEQPLEKILNKSTSSRRRWLRYMKMAQERSSRDGKRQTLLTNFFRTSVTVTQRSDTLEIRTPT